ncbi:MAG: hypothetical protein JSS66_10805 [Armatimonadetes bacterium]|nr:hypothetical protein [Armatimonadota bacterium]
MFSRLALLIAVVPLLLGQLPRTVTLCLCTGDVVSDQIKDTDLCKRHHAAHCGHCAPGPKKGCYLKTGDSPSPSLLAMIVKVDCPAVLLTPPVLQERAYFARCEPRFTILHPRIREPDIGGHLLRGPPSLA